jgi:hypothetical protein
MTTESTALPGTRHRISRKSLRSLPPPPNWSIHDWTIELDQVAAIAAWEAANDFDPPSMCHWMRLSISGCAIVV